jgi:hypothetical protein
MRGRHSALLGAFSIAALCAPLSGCAVRSSGVPEATYHRNANRITTDELRAGPDGSMYEVVRRLRPAWIRPRSRLNVGQGTVAEVVVYVDGFRRGGVESLRTIMPSGVLQLDYLDPSTATLRFGNNHQHGAIMVTSGSGP